MKRHNSIALAGAGALSILAAPLIVRSPVADAARDFARATHSISDPTTQLASIVTGKHLGFDTSEYPGDDAMLKWKRAAPYEWVGYYLPAPCHRDPSWSGKRETLTGMGWGIAVVYVGQQSWGKDPARPVRTTIKKRVRDKRGRMRTVRQVVTRKLTAPAGSTCAAAFLSANRGRAEARDAIERTLDEGFAPGTVIFLDIERMESTPKAMRDYYREWTRGILEDGRFQAGYYVHTHNAERVYNDVLPLHRAAGKTGEPAFWVAGNGNERFSHDREPTDVGHAFASVWQGILDKVETRSGVRIPIDVNVASVPSPSTHATLLAD
jgi:hypothetical protein